jgi:hypothetical protein
MGDLSQGNILVSLVVKLPKFDKVRKEYFGIGSMGPRYTQVDVCGRVGKNVWLGESKLWKKRVPYSEAKKIYGVKKFLGDEYKVQIFYFADSGITKQAEKLLRENLNNKPQHTNTKYMLKDLIGR